MNMDNFFHTKYQILNTRYRIRGFTLIELLVVVAIIGILSTVVFATISGTRPRARDAKRLSDVKQMALITSVEATSLSATRAFAVCTGADADVTTCTGPGTVSEFVNFKDPSNPSAVCATGASAPCKYSISKKSGAAAATVDDYQICFYLEDPVAQGYTSGQNLLRVVSPVGNVEVGCL